MSPLLPWSAQPTYTVELLFGSTAIESVEPMRSCPRVGALDHGIETRLTTIRPGNLSDGSFNAWKGDRKSTRLNSSHSQISYAVFCLKKKKDCTMLTFDGACTLEATNQHDPKLS